MKTKPKLREVRLALQSKASLLEKFYSSGADDYFAEILRRALELLPKREPRGVTIIYNVSKRRRKRK